MILLMILFYIKIKDNSIFEAFDYQLQGSIKL